MKKCNKFMAVVAVILAFALTFTSVSVPANAAAAKNTKTVKSITVKNLPSNTLTLKAGKTFTLKTNTTSGNLKFSTSNKKIVKVSSTGKIKAVKKGSAKITISLKSNAKIKKVVKVTVGQPATRVKVNKSALTIKKGKSAVIKATVGPNTASNKKVIWKSSNSKIAKVSATGRVTAVKGGKVTITAVAADGSGKKAVCKVTVKASIKSLKFSKTSGKMYVGKTMHLSPVIKPADATNKKCAWSSSNDKVVMVNSAGKVYAVATGTAVITAKATDGTGKKATYKVTVAKAITIASATVKNPQTIQVTLSESQKLSASSFTVKKSRALNGTYNYTIPVDSVTTKDNKTYTLALRRGCNLSDYDRVCIYVNGLEGTGTSKIETYYSEDKTNSTTYLTYNIEQNTSFSKELEDRYTRGIGIFTVGKLPDGVTYEKKLDGTNIICFRGTPTKAGITKTTVKLTDELGNVDTYIITWNIYNSSAISACYIPQYYMINTEYKNCTVDLKIASVAGGSGKYTYSIVGDNYGLSVDSTGKITGKIYQEGTYNLKVKITDANNAKISTIVNCELNAKKAINVQGCIKDLSGKVLAGASISFYSRDKDSPYQLSWDWDVAKTGGKYEMDLFPGAYDVVVQMCGEITYIDNQKFDKSETGRDFVLEVLKLAVHPDNAKYSVDYIGTWYDEYDRHCGYDGYVYLVPGTQYKLTARGMGQRGVITAKVDRKAVSVTAKMTEDVTEIGDKTSFFAEENGFYKFVPKTTGTYYFYSISTSDPYGHLYDENKKKLVEKDDDKHDLTANKYDFYMSYNCVAGKTYYISISRYSSNVYISKTNPKSGN